MRSGTTVEKLSIRPISCRYYSATELGCSLQEMLAFSLVVPETTVYEAESISKFLGGSTEIRNSVLNIQVEV